MQRYQYQHGDQPLDGYTIQRAAGRGGFGEVYYAVSDSGREVAIKAVQNYEQIELRGISQCMNIKSPHLITIFDVKYNDRKDPFVIMEYVSGPSLRDLLTESPHGLGVQKAAFFLREIAKGLSFLHECGVVHRDLKPSNVFYENGYVKIGDYGLAKAMSASRHSGHTITVGTVHYMAPEIGVGSYNCSIDIYALGVLLYEMLTGDVPFVGSSPAEILMKHMTVTPELDNIEEPFAGVIRKALAKDPADRYETVQEMVEDLFGSENIRNSVSHFSPDDLSVVAQRVAAKANIVERPGAEKPEVDKAHVGARPTKEMGSQIAETAQRFARQADVLGRKVADRVDAETGKLLGSKVHIPGITDPVDPRQRRTLALLSMALIAVGAGLLHEPHGGRFLQTAVAVFGMIAICSKTILLCHQRWFANLEPESRWVEKLVTCCSASFLAVLFAAILLKIFGIPETEFNPSGPGLLRSFSGTWFSLAVPMLLADWRRISSSQRPKRLSLGSALWIGLLGLISAEIFGQAALVVASVLAGTSLVVQAYSSFGRATPRAPAAQAQPRRSMASGLVPASVRVWWLVASLVTLGLGLFLLIWGVIGSNDGQFALGIASGVDSLILSLFCLVGALRSRFTGWYRYIIKPAILLVCVLTVVASSICMGCLSLNDELFIVVLLLIIFPAAAFFVAAILPASLFVGSAPKPTVPAAAPSKPPAASIAKLPAGVSSFKRLWALLLSAGSFFGVCGLQRFYVGKIGTGILWFLTGGLFGIGQLIDVIMIVVGQFKDRYGLPLVIWQDETELGTQKPSPAAQPPVVERDVAAAIAQPREAVQSPSVEDLPTPPAPYVPATTVIYEPFHPFAFLFSGIGFILTFAAIVAGLAVGLHIPRFVAAGWPDADLATELEQFFGYSGWPELVMRLGTIIVVILLLLAAIFTIIGRRHLGARHLIRVVLGLGGFVLAMITFSDAMSGRYFQEVVDLLNSQQIGPAFEKLLRSTQNEEALLAGVLFLVSVVVLAWPPNRRQMILTPAPNRGAS
ncbi:MAG: protein kinase domain-containing protein [Planctomycetota bacterium]|jgi:hypothetical protein